MTQKKPQSPKPVAKPLSAMKPAAPKKVVTGKKPVPGKAAPVVPAPKAPAKPAPSKPAAKPAPAPAKAAVKVPAKPAPAPAKPAPKAPAKPVGAKPAPAKPATKPAPVKPAATPAKLAATPAKPAATPAKPAATPAKPVAKPAAKPAPAPAKPAAALAKPAVKPAPAPIKPVVKPASVPAKPVAAAPAKPVVAKPAAKPAPVPARPAPKAPAKAPAKSAYAVAGVDIEAKMNGVKAIREMVKSTATRGVVGGIGHFGGLFASPGEGNLLVASSDGVGTKLKVAVLAKKHGTVGQDLVNHCVNDILVLGAKPLFFMDYVGASRFDAETFKSVVSGLCKACRENGCALLGGETAELPGLYPAGEYDLVGTIVGVVDKKKVITGKTIKPGDVLIGLPSRGLQTNGYSLARKVLFDQCGFTVNDTLPGTSTTIGDALLAIHQSFLRPVEAVMKKVQIQGMAHITGGGFVDNIPRILPANCDAVIDRASWKVPAIFQFIGRQGRVDIEEMYRVFNMGIGFILVVRPADAPKALAALKEAHAFPAVIGAIAKGRGVVAFKDGTP